MNYVKSQSSKDEYTPVNKDKYKGEYPIRIMSEWERQFFKWCDNNSSVIFWSSEPIAVPYYDPVKRKERRYFPDVLMKCKTKSGDVKVYLVEIKPYKDICPSKKSRGKSKKTVLHEQTTHLTNMAKFKSAMQYCKKRDWIFKIITEKELFGK